MFLAQLVKKAEKETHIVMFNFLNIIFVSTKMTKFRKLLFALLPFKFTFINLYFFFESKDHRLYENMNGLKCAK